MISKIERLKKEIEAYTAATIDDVNAFRSRFTGKKGLIPSLFTELKTVSNDQRKKYGSLLNNLKQVAEAKLTDLSAGLAGAKGTAAAALDFTLPEVPGTLGNLHPLSLVRNRIIEIFERLGFNVEEGPEIEDDWHNFTALNFPRNHPAREMQDTFFISRDPDVLLRTHTSNVQIRLMQKQKPPLRSIMPGRVFRNEAISARAHCFFHQVEGLYIDKNVGFSDLKQTLYHFARELFGQEINIRFRPSFFPFTEPSAEIDITCLICHGKGCNVCKHSGWVEIAGSGMVHPNVLRNCKIDPDAYTGFAFGMGVERITMLKYQVNDLRLFSENDLRFLRQFQSVI